MRSFRQFRPAIIRRPKWLFLVVAIFLYAVASGVRAGSYTAEALTIPRQAFSGQASTINDAGVSAGWYQTSRGWSAVSWSADGALTQLGTLSGLSNALANGINQSGVIVGY